MKRTTAREQADEIGRLARALAERVESAEAERPALRLAGSKEAATILGVTDSLFATFRRRKQVPTPVAELACGPIWLADDLEAWARTEMILRKEVSQ